MLEFYPPIKPHIVNQAWGVYDPATYSQFGFNRHNGIDHKLAADKKIYSPFACTVVKRGYQPNGGGVYVGLISDEYDFFPTFTNYAPDGKGFQFPAGRYRVLVDLLHLDTIKVEEGARLAAGELVAIGDNTGFSTGPHCHTQWRRVTWDGKVIMEVDRNDANNSFDPTQFFAPTFAADFQSNIFSLKAQVLDLLKLVGQLFKRSV
jgi:murein DD-endopeptidase MepM/ murein hydrolase activator NlpD